MLKTAMGRPGWTIPDYDMVTTYWLHNLDDMQALTTDPEWAELEKEAVTKANMPIGHFVLGREIVHFEGNEAGASSCRLHGIEDRGVQCSNFGHPGAKIDCRTLTRNSLALLWSLPSGKVTCHQALRSKTILLKGLRVRVCAYSTRANLFTRDFKCFSPYLDMRDHYSELAQSDLVGLSRTYFAGPSRVALV